MRGMTVLALVLLDLLLALGAALRLTRFVVADDVPGNFWIKPLAWRLLMGRDAQRHTPTRYNYWRGLSCPFCMSVWASAAVALALWLAGGPGDAADWWRWVAGFLSLAWLTAHIAAYAGDTED